MTDTLKSLSITNSDQTIIVPNPTGNGAQGFMKNISDFVTPTAAGIMLTASTYKMVRVPTNIKLKSLKLVSDGALDTSTGLGLDVGAYYSDSTVDGTAVANQGVLISANCFLANSAGFQSSAKGPVEGLTAYSVAARNQPLWQGLGLASDPGGMIDIVIAVHTLATTGGSAKLWLSADFVE